MAYVSQVQYEQGSSGVKAAFDDQIKKHGRITNMKKTLLHSLPAYHALMEWYPLRDAVAEFIGERAVNFFCYAISSENDCLICTTFFAKILKDLDLEFEEFAFTEMEELIIQYGKLLVKQPSSISVDIFDRLKKLFNEEQIVELTALAGLMIATNLINTALQVDLDDVLIPYMDR